MSDLEQRLIEIVWNYPDLMHVMTTVRSLDLPDWLIFSGSVYQSVWNAQTGREPGYGVNDRMECERSGDAPSPACCVPLRGSRLSGGLCPIGRKPVRQPRARAGQSIRVELPLGCPTARPTRLRTLTERGGPAARRET